MTKADARGRYGKYVRNAIVAGDFAILNIAFLITYLVLGRFTEYPIREVLLALNVAYIPVAAIFSGIHNRRSAYMERIVRHAVFSVVTHAIFFTILLYLLQIWVIDRKFFILFYISFGIMLPAWWMTARLILKHIRIGGSNYTRAVIVGTGPTARYLYHEMTTDPGFGYRFMGFFSNAPSPDTPKGTHRGSIAQLADFIRDNAIDEVYYTLSGESDRELNHVINAAENNVAQFFYVPQISRYISRGFYLNTLGSIPVLSLMNQPLQNVFNRSIKRTFDIAFSALTLAILGPTVFLPVAIAVKLSSPGPVLFKQLRTGYKGRDFYCYKFRTMRVNADADSKQAERDDPRKTRVGNFLRRTNIDELPQFYNVLIGNMSVVGPRPHMLKHTHDYSRLVDRYMVRHYIKPGITGWAQVTGFRGETKELWQMEKRVEHDVWYVNHWSFLLDMKIIVRTITNTFRGEKNAY